MHGSRAAFTTVRSGERDSIHVCSNITGGETAGAALISLCRMYRIGVYCIIGASVSVCVFERYVLLASILRLAQEVYDYQSVGVLAFRSRHEEISVV